MIQGAGGLFDVNGADPNWAQAGTLSQKAIRALRSTTGVSVVLVGMRRDAYVEDVLTELHRTVEQTDRRDSWHKLTIEAQELFNSRSP